MTSAYLHRLAAGVGATMLLVVTAAPALAQQPKYKPLVVRAPDAVTIAAQEWGNPAGPEILFIHGFSQASLKIFWSYQYGHLGIPQEFFHAVK